MIITLCGSTKFIKEFNNANMWLTMHGNIVLTVGSFHHSDNDPEIRDIIMKNKTTLDYLHKTKISMSNAVMIIDVNNYIGDSTREELEYARLLRLPIYSYTKAMEHNTNLRYLGISELYDNT
jgi:hypothetical protein